MLYRIFDMMLSTNLIVKSINGRELSPAPKIDCTTDRKCKSTIKRINKWLKEESIKECCIKENEFALQMVEAIRLDNISPSDVSMMNMILFDE